MSARGYWFGLELATAMASEGGAPSWGARAIFELGQVDLLHDRQQAEGAEESKRQALEDWVNVHGLPALRKWAREVTGSSTEMFVYRHGGYVLKATPRKSFGYMYMGACREVDEDKARHRETP